MKAHRVATVRLLGQEVQFGFRLRTVGPILWHGAAGGWRGWRWKVADAVLDHSPVPQCWSDLVDWVMGHGQIEQPLRDLRPLDVLPWRPVRAMCRAEAARCGACYCGNVATRELLDTGNGPEAQIVVAAEVSA